MTHCGFRLLAALLLSNTVVTAAHAQQPSAPKSQPQAGTETKLADDISKDLADLNALIQALAPPPSAELQDWITNRTPSTIFKTRSGTIFHSQPDSTAPVVYKIAAGDPVQVLDRKGDWALARTESQHVGWIQFSQVTQNLGYEQILQTLLTRVQQLKAKYENSPIKISGFSIDLKMPPGVSVQFEFR